MKHHVNAIIGDDFWQVVKEEKLQEGDFEVESLMSFGRSYCCRSTSEHVYRSTTPQSESIDRISRASIDDTNRVIRILQCREDSDSRGVRSKTPISAQPR